MPTTPQGRVNLFIIYYEQYFRVTLGWLHFRLSRSPRNLVLIENFILRVEQHYEQPDLISPAFLKFYFEYSFGENATRTWKGKRVIMVNQIISKRVWAMFLASTKGQKWGKRMRLVRNAVAYQHDVADYELIDSPAYVEKNSQEREIYSAVPSHEEADRSRFFNTMKGYLWCGNETTMFHPGSDYCSRCKFLEQCKQRQEVNYPSLAKLRLSLPHTND